MNVQEKLTNEEIDKEIARLRALKTFEHKTGDGHAIKLDTVYYYVTAFNKIIEVVIKDEWRIQEYKVVGEYDDHNYSDLFTTKEGALQKEIKYAKWTVEKAEKNLAKYQDELEELEKLYEELSVNSTLE